MKPDWSGTQQKLWMGSPLLEHLNSMGLSRDKMESLWSAYKLAREHDEDMMAKNRESGKPLEKETSEDNQTVHNKPTRIGALVLGTLSRIFQIIELLYKNSSDGGRDYRLVLTRSRAVEYTRKRKSRDDVLLPYELHMSLWCLNPSIAFRMVASAAHSVILTSGTLSPLDSFSSELGTSFGVVLEAPHVVNMKKQVFAGVISQTPSGDPIQATYQHVNKAEFQDALGDIILKTCRTVPDGILVFFPSYSLLDKVVVRWRETGIMEDITSCKPFVQEPRGGGTEALKEVMEKYYQGINSGCGGVFLAVCRGKVSEGLDFSDANARGVIIVGIPFPNLKDPKVEVKRKYNDMGSRNMGLLNGSLWYEQQAFRALNQALGRCIRHKLDWGAILLVDERFKLNARYQNSLSRWYVLLRSFLISLLLTFSRLTLSGFGVACGRFHLLVRHLCRWKISFTLGAKNSRQLLRKTVLVMY